MQQQAKYRKSAACDHCLHHEASWVIPGFWVNSEHSRHRDHMGSFIISSSTATQKETSSWKVYTGLER